MMVILDIDEELGYRRWLAKLTDDEYQVLLKKWATIKGLNALVPVPFVIPQAKRIDYDEIVPEGALTCHMHEWDDSWLDGFGHGVPKTEDYSFWMEGFCYDRDTVGKMYDKWRDTTEAKTVFKVADVLGRPAL